MKHGESHTLPKTIFGVDPAWRAPWYRRLIARLLGEMFIGSDGTTIVVGRYFNGRFYIEDIRHD